MLRPKPYEVRKACPHEHRQTTNLAEPGLRPLTRVQCSDCGELLFSKFGDQVLWPLDHPDAFDPTIATVMSEEERLAAVRERFARGEIRAEEMEREIGRIVR